MWQEATNTFNEGLVMDLNPLTTPNNVLTSCLNGTIITYNGNEYVLQNDMGNGRVESAYLPVGYVPVGMTEFGGIVYVISYNPQLDKSQIGSFPSPERNISSEELSDSQVVLTNSDFGYTDRASIFYVQKDLYKDKLNPGDKFIVYANKGEITGNEEKLDELKEDNQTKLVRLSLATITDEGKIVKLTNLKKYEIEGEGYTYIIPEMEEDPESGFPVVDSYRSITESPYNVFNSKVSGKLLLIAELITIDSFNVVTDVEFEEKQGTQTEKDAIIKVSMSYESEDNVYLYAVSGKVTDTTPEQTTEQDVSYKWPGNTREESEVLLYQATDYNIQERPQRDILWELTPCMKFGPIPYLKKSGIVELDKVGTGFIDLSEWRYYIDNNNLQLNWALQSYPEPGYKITKVRFVLKKFEADNTISTITYNISDKKSYNGSFTEIIPFNSVFYKIAENKQLEKNQLYGVTIEVDYGNGNPVTSKTLRFYRFLYTTDVFNKKYIEGKVSDFESLKPELNITATTKYNFEKISQTQSEQLGKMVTNEEILEADTLSATSIYTNLKLTGEVIPSLTKNYNLFVVDESSVQIDTEIEKGGITFGPYSVTYTQSDSVNMNNYLELRENTKYPGGTVELPTQDRMDELVNEDSKTNYDSGLCIQSSEIQNQKFDVNIDIVEFIKAFAKPSKETITYKGILQPVAYDEETFGNYNLKLDINSGKFIGTATCAFGQYEEGGRDGNEWYFDATGGKLQYQTRSVEPIDDITTEFSSNESQNAMNTAWKSIGNSSIAVCIYQYPVSQQHHLIVENKDINTSWPWYRGIYSGDGNPDKQVSYNEGCNRNDVWKNGDDGKSAVFIFIKGTDGKWYAINMVFNMGFQDYAINLSYLKFNNYLQGSQDNKNMASAFYNIYTVLASMLNQMYAYREETQTEQKYIPVSIYYIPKYTTNFNLNINNTISTNNANIQIMLSESEKKSLSEYETIELFNELAPTDDLNTNNITPQLTSTNESIVATYKTQNSGIDLRDKILEYQKNRYGALIITNTGEVLTSESNLNPQNLYYILDNAPKKLDKNFKFKKANYWNEQYIPTIIDEAVSSQNIANKFTMLDGQLRLNESFAPPKTRLFRGSTEQTDDGGIGTFSDFAPIDFLKCWEGS